MVHNEPVPRTILLDSGGVSGGPPLLNVLNGDADGDTANVRDPMSWAWSSDAADQLSVNADALATSLLRDNGSVRAVLAHCMNIGFALEVVTKLAERRAAPRATVLLAPVTITMDVLVRQTAEFMVKLGETPSDAASEAAALWSAGGTIADVVEALTVPASRHASALGLNDADVPGFASTLVERYSRWLSYLWHQSATPTAVPEIDLAIVDVDPDAVRRRFEDLVPPDNLYIETCPHPERFDDPDVRSQVRRILRVLA